MKKYRKTKELKLQGRSEARRSVIWLKRCGEMQRYLPHGKSMKEESAGKEPERRLVCLCGKWVLEDVRLRMCQMKQRNRNGRK